MRSTAAACWGGLRPSGSSVSSQGVEDRLNGGTDPGPACGVLDGRLQLLDETEEQILNVWKLLDGHVRSAHSMSPLGCSGGQ